MSSLEQVIASPNRGGHATHSEHVIRCTDGFTFSAATGQEVASTPRAAQCEQTERIDFLGNLTQEHIASPGVHVDDFEQDLNEAECDYPGPFTHIQVERPSTRPEPWSVWEQYAEDPSAPTATVYRRVPAEIVRSLVEMHGFEGERAAFDENAFVIGLFALTVTASADDADEEEWVDCDDPELA